MFEALPFDHPLYVLFSSGTTGPPKGIVHGHGGQLLDHVRHHALHFDLGPADRFFFYTTTNWMIWNWLVAGLLAGSTIVLYDGSPRHPELDGQFAIAAQTARDAARHERRLPDRVRQGRPLPRRRHDLGALRAIASTGSPAAARDLPVDPRGGRRARVADLHERRHGHLLGVRERQPAACPSVPGRSSAAAWAPRSTSSTSDGRPLRDEVGELVLTAPLPSMPVRFWNDPDGERYRASYFDHYPGVWRHGDWATLTDDGSVVILGRSDSTLNRHGVRIGTAEIYAAIDGLPEIADSLIIGVEEPDGGYWMPLFVALEPATELDDGLRARILDAIRAAASPRHVPDEVVQVPAIPRTHTGKKLEIPIKRIFMGADPADHAQPRARSPTPWPSTPSWRWPASVRRAAAVRTSRSARRPRAAASRRGPRRGSRSRWRPSPRPRRGSRSTCSPGTITSPSRSPTIQSPGATRTPPTTIVTSPCASSSQRGTQSCGVT